MVTRCWVSGNSSPKNYVEIRVHYSNRSVFPVMNRESYIQYLAALFPGAKGARETQVSLYLLRLPAFEDHSNAGFFYFVIPLLGPTHRVEPRHDRAKNFLILVFQVLRKQPRPQPCCQPRTNELRNDEIRRIGRCDSAKGIGEGSSDGNRRISERCR